MYHSLYQTIKPLVDAKASGVLHLFHVSRQNGTVQLKEGTLEGFVQGDHSGLDAAKIILRWINLAAIYLSGETATLPPQKPVTTASVMQQLKKIDTMVEGFVRQIGGCDAVFQFIGQQVSETLNFTAQELSVSFMLDGRTAIRDIESRCNMNELDLLATVCRLIGTGLVRQVQPHRFMPEDTCALLIERLNTGLSEIVGPVAEVIIKKALDATMATGNDLAACDIPLLLSVIQFYLEDDEKEMFARWSEGIEGSLLN